MIDITVTTGCNCRLQIPPMEPSLSHGTVRRSTFSDITTSGTGKRRRLDRQDEYNHFQLQYQYQRDVDVNLLENVASSFMCSVNDDLITDLKAEYVTETELQQQHDADVNLLENVASVSVTSDHANSSFTCSVNDGSNSDLKAECVSGTESFMSVPDGFRNTSASSVICLETEETESVSTSKSNNNKKKKTTPATGTVTVAVAEDEATSRRKPPAPAAIMPCAAEIEEFFSKAEKYEQKRFVEKYNYDIVKDVPMEGRYQWIELKP
ncbi:putative cyclin-dependent kinase inhibitor [Helianthus annuus]|uniref:Cyclin-dependent kinase inhibitor n=1 Tax=Helianthus annuus TaxID=4232 RepID=A0A9K3JD01_HELAN|nr:cyclin-dependent kinase inhibitor 6 isoform X2 [Helianthus annuus]KAF5812382.1 putative cyclin-dependent kinase inhibitor [Helianthus annuus]KAJ0598923.1 putative cyclin-dependent kinase inhibitor domain-containing protein [Helianthus annuus]KAJ0763162.1 putative cyclin-dependent kinase inhibitor domain-containing protein [Helianthus annuus]KAJ0929134.1 putative cyclin-dependent kinase inhibitor [Helianthus annuus]